MGGPFGALDLVAHELGGVKPLAFGQYGELGPGFEQLLDQLAEEAVRTKRPGGTSSPTA